MTTSTTVFKPSIRDAGNIYDSKLYGSFKSLNKFESTIQKSKHDDIFRNKEFESFVSPKEFKQPNEELKANNNNNDETDKQEKIKRSKDKSNKDRSESRKSKSRHHKEDREKRKESERQEKQKEIETRDEDFIKSLGQKHERRRKRFTEDERPSSIDENINSNNNRNEEKENFKSAEKFDYRINKDSFKPIESSHHQHHLENTLRNENVKEFETLKNNERKNSLLFMSNKDLNSNSKSDSESDNDEEVKIAVERQKQHELSIKKLDIDSHFFKTIRKSSTLEFILMPAPQGQTINCKIICRKNIITEYLFFLENYNGVDLLLMKTHRRMSTAKLFYLIEAINYEEFSNNRVSGEYICGKIVSNMSRKKFKLKLDESVSSAKNEILTIVYKSNTGEPKRTIADACLCSGTSFKNDKVTYFLKNRPPHYDIGLRKYVLNYNGRAKMSSKNNFQIIDESYPDDILMQLGKVETKEYNCDFTFPLCALQAFGFGLASLCSK